MAAKPTVVNKKMAKQLTGKRDESMLHLAVRRGDLSAVKEILSDYIESEEELGDVLRKQNQCGETALYVAAEYGDAEMVAELIQYYDLADAETKARNGYDPFHIAAKGELVEFRVYKLNREEKRWEEVRELEDVALFVGEDCSFSVQILAGGFIFYKDYRNGGRSRGVCSDGLFNVECEMNGDFFFPIKPICCLGP